jgi:REP element-mobilizing transposase RayT
MDDYESPIHTKWDCKYHVVFIPKCRRRTLYVELRRHLGELFRKPAMQKESRIEEGHPMPDHVRVMISNPPKYAGIRARARSIWPACMERASAIQVPNTSEPRQRPLQPLRAAP